jgi:two-component system chemotaxis response regulator CheB
MSEKIRVLVVDDSAFMRKIISDILSSQIDIEVIDTARDGEAAVLKTASLKPDVITLDVEMPKKNGLEALKEIKKISDAQVIMLSSLTSEGSSITIEALNSGAFDFIQKPSGAISLDIDKVKDELIEKIRYSMSYKTKLHTNKLKTQITVKNQGIIKVPQSRPTAGKIDAVVIGASTGGPKVLYDLITKLPYDLNIPVFVVQHMPAGFTKAFADRINRNTGLTVVEAKDGDIIQPNWVYIAPGGYHMYINQGNIKLDQSPTIHGVRPAVDKLFLSASESYRGRLLGCILTGMGKDGADGIKRIKDLGGYTISQDEESSTIYGMPKAAYETGCIDIVLSDSKIPEEITRAVKRM